MNDHDPLCPLYGNRPWGTCVLCDLIAKVRADERKEPRDEYHTMAELYEYRMLYNAAFANHLTDQLNWTPTSSRAVKSYKHSDGEPCFGGGWFIVTIELPTGQVSNHYENEHWDLFQVPEVDRAPVWDGHTPAEAADRLRRYCEGT